ncbi:MAG: hypothetical protein H0X18_09435 [Geodermatophilaceae bacterium]|nr:hypothetical protein [Geodermatophilaceae bacterium]
MKIVEMVSTGTVLWLLFFSAVIGFGIYGWYAARKRRAAMHTFAASMGFGFAPHDR